MSNNEYPVIGQMNFSESSKRFPVRHIEGLKPFNSEGVCEVKKIGVTRMKVTLNPLCAVLTEGH